MKKFRFNVFLAAMLLFAAVAPMLTSCSKDSANAEDILATVPADTPVVAVVNVEKMLDAFGCKANGSEITVSDKIDQAFKGNLSPEEYQNLKKALAGDSGIEFSVIVYFVSNGYPYITGNLSDPDKFKSFCIEQKIAKESFSEDNGVEVSGSVALKGTRFWLGVGATADGRTIKSFLDLSEKNSFLSNGYAENLVEVDKAVEGWADLSGVMNLANVDFQSKAMAQVALQTIFKDVEDLGFDLSIDKNEANVKVTPLNSKGKPAKCILPLDKIDEKVVKNLGGDCNVLMAAAISQKGVKKLQEAVSGNGPSYIGEIVKVLGCLDGTMAFAGDSNGRGIKGVVSTTGTDTSALVSMLNMGKLTVGKEGNLLMCKTAEPVSGPLQVAEAAKYIDGSTIGVVAKGVGSMSAEDGVVAFTLRPENETLTINLQLHSEKALADMLVDSAKKARF